MYKCIKSFELQMVDDDGRSIDLNKKIHKDSIWKVSNKSPEFADEKHCIRLRK